MSHSALSRVQIMLRGLVVFFACLLALGHCWSLNPLARKQSAGVRGQLLCNDRPAAGVLVKLYDEDDFGKDDLLAKTTTDSQGRFQIWGTEEEVTPIDPKFNIYHDCNDGIKPCSRKFTIKIPDRYISQGPHVNTFYEAGTIQLAGKFPGESRDCIH